MKRTHCDENNDKELDDSLLDLHFQSDECENESSKKPKTVVKTTVMAKDESLFQSQKITESCDDLVTDYSDVSETHIKDAVPNDTNKTSEIHEKETNNMAIPSEKKRVKLLELLEAISSDDDIAMDSEEDGDSDDGEHFNEYIDDIVTHFDPSLFQATPLRIIQDPSLSLFEYIHRKLGDDSKCNEVAELMDSLEYLSKTLDINEKWIITAERTIIILPKTLSHILNIPEYCHKLFSLVNVTLDFECALKEHVSMSTLILRHLKVGIQLIEVLCHYNEDLSEHLIKHHQIHNKLINLFFVEHMSLSLKLNILRALDSSLNGLEPIRLFLCDEVFDGLNGNQTLLKILSIHQRPRVCFLVTSILRKIHFYELLQKMNTDVKALDSNQELLLQECLAEITTTYNKAPILMGCPKRFLQAHAQFELTPALTHFDVYPTIYRLFDDLSLINCLIKVLDQPNGKGTLEQNILELFKSLMDCDHGLRYLCCRHKELNELINILDKVNTQFKLALIYKVKVLTLIDYLSYFWECNLMQNFRLDQMDSVDFLHDMFLLTQSTVGKCAVVNVLTMGDNLDVILNFFKYLEQCKSKSDDLHIIYSLDLMKIVLENAEDVSYLKKYGTLIYELACKHNFLNDLIDWTFPSMRHSAFFHDDVSELCNIVKNNKDNCLNFNKTLITSLRILRYLGLSNDETVFERVEDFVELKYKYITLQMYSYDMLGTLLTIVDKICGDYKQPSVNVWKLTGNKAKNLISIIRPSMMLIRYMIALLIQTRRDAFKDLSPIKVLLKLYNLMHNVPECSIIHEDATKVAKDIHKTLEAYVEIKIGSSMANEVIVWTLSCPSVFFPGLLLLCKLLPLPLPIQTMKPLEESVIQTMISFRNMWIDHLTKINSNLIELITVLSSSSLLLQPLKSLCINIADLSISTCLLVTRTILDALVSVDNNDCFNQCLNLLTQLCDNKKFATIKTAVLQILNDEKLHENYKKCIYKICENIKVNDQGNSLLFVQCICDADIVLSSTGSYSEENLPRDSVPNKWFYTNILKALLSSFESYTKLSKLFMVIKTCIVIIKNDYGFYQFKMVLDSFPKPFYNIFDNIMQNWNKEDIHCSNTLISTVELLNLCTKNDINTKRKLFMNSSMLRKYLNWSNDGKDHPLCLLKEIMQNDNNLICYEHLVHLSEFLNNGQESVEELAKPQLATVDLLTYTYKNRLFYVVNNSDKNYINQSIDLYNDVINNLGECNIEEVVSDLPDFNIKDKINDLFKIEDCIVQPDPIVHKREPVVIEKKENTINTSVNNTSTPIIRHKVFSRLGTIQRSDAFRNRSPNTSRPPSLHVDDFVAMETRNVRQPRYKLPIQPIQDLNIRLRERQMAYERSYNLLSPYKSHLSLHNWHAQFNAMAHLRADYRQTMSSRHLEIHRHSLVAEWRQLRVEAELRKNLAYSRR
ncbi:protein virilizer homolog isoform X2 [Rhopalosiphum padi]|uniref:protein virilizer homolog isoform X2 n=1 Tax=Rhopalosiphum padi TaxID=40932 RepID=UPI00298DB87A|nr:protein virilizer homolog isoform X2 [Rhopalosiphum padi]